MIHISQLVDSYLARLEQEAPKEKCESHCLYNIPTTIPSNPFYFQSPTINF